MYFIFETRHSCCEKFSLSQILLCFSLNFSESDEKGSESHLQLEYIELMKLQAYLTSRILQEREQVESLRIELSSLANSLPETSVHNISPRNW